MSCPSAISTPVLGVTMPHMMLISVVLPAPFGPSSAKTSPRWISRSTRSSAFRPDAYVLVRLEMEMIGGMRVSNLARGAGWPRARCRGRRVVQHRQQGNIRGPHIHADPRENGMDLAPMVGLMIEHLQYQGELRR